MDCSFNFLTRVEGVKLILIFLKKIRKESTRDATDVSFEVFFLQDSISPEHWWKNVAKWQSASDLKHSTTEEYIVFWKMYLNN